MWSKQTRSLSLKKQKWHSSAEQKPIKLRWSTAASTYHSSRTEGVLNATGCIVVVPAETTQEPRSRGHKFDRDIESFTPSTTRYRPPPSFNYCLQPAGCSNSFLAANYPCQVATRVVQNYTMIGVKDEDPWSKCSNNESFTWRRESFTPSLVVDLRNCRAHAAFVGIDRCHDLPDPNQ